MKPIITRVRVPHGHLFKRNGARQLMRLVQARAHRARAGHAHAAIVGGQSISIVQAPWQVVIVAVLSETEALICGGSILDSTEILTAGHCVFNLEKKPFAASQIVVGAGSDDINVEPEQVVVANAVRTHPYYNPSAALPSPDDVAVISLGTPLVMNSAVKAIALAVSGTRFQEGAAANLTGFGAENPAEELDGELHSIGLTVGFSGDCSGEFDALFLCASSPSGADCFGDSGSALTMSGALIGVTDTTEVIGGVACLDGSTGGYVDVAAPEIRDFVVNNAPKPPLAPRGASTTSLSGVTRVGEALTCGSGEWTNTPVTLTYEFIDSTTGQLLQQGASETMPLSPADVARDVVCEVFATNEGGTAIGRSRAMGPIRPTALEEQQAQAAREEQERELAEKRREGEKQERELAAKRRDEEAARTGQGVGGFQMVAPSEVPDAKLVGTASTVSLSGIFSIKISCPAAETSCTGTVTLRTLGAVIAAAGSSAKVKAAILTLARGSFTVQAGKSRRVTLHLSSKVRALLERVRVLHARATIVAHDPAGATHTTQTNVTLHALRSKHG